MPLNYEQLMSAGNADVAFNYTDKDRRLYALATGFGSNPVDENELPYVVETLGSHTVPTMASTMAYPEFMVNCGWDYKKVLHSEQKLELYRPMPKAANLLMSSKVASVIDRGPNRGAVIRVVTEARLKRDDTAMFTAESTLIARGDGGFGGPGGQRVAPAKPPQREPDLSCDLLLRPDQALLYRLTGDRNPLHSEPAVARAAGFDQPILHGLCTYGVACRAILKTICNYDFTLINGFDVRFSAPVYPGDVLTTDMWQDRNVVSFQSSVKARGVTVLKGGRCTLVV